MDAASPAPTLRQMLRPYGKVLLLVSLLAACEVALDGAMTLSYKFLIDYAIVPRDRHALLTILWILAGVLVLASATAFWRDRYHAKTSARMVAQVRTRVFEHSQRLPVGYYAGRRASDLLNLFSSDLTVIETLVTSVLHAVLLPALSVAMAVGLLFLLLDWRLALVGSLVWPLVLVGPRIVTPKAAAAAQRKKEEETRLLGSVEEAIAGYRVIKGYGLDAFIAQRFRQLLAPLSATLARATFLGSLVERSTVISIYAVQFAALAIGANMAFDGVLSVGSFIAFLTIFWSLGWSIVVLARSAPLLISAAVSARRIDNMLAQPVDPLDREGAQAMPPLARELQLNHVRFAYPGRPPVLKDVSLAIRQGEFVAFVGPSGSGKSSILNILSRQYGVDSGRIEVDGRDMDEFTADSIRAQMGLVFQESVLFDMSVRENIRLGLLGASDDEVEAAARRAEVHDAILALPQGYETNVGERGALLSGGQRQRVAIARALIRNPSLLLLDEASSALDPASEAAINETLLRASEGRTLVSVTHRLDSVMRADRIFVVDAGTIAETGSHDELVARNGLYADLWRKQHGFHVSKDGSVASVTVARLREIRLLAPLSDAQLKALLEKFVSERVQAGQTVIRQGERGNLFYILVRGSMVVTLRDADGHEREFARLADGDEFGEMALLYDQPRNATITARTDCLILSLTQEHFAELLASAPAIRQQVEKLAAERGVAAPETGGWPRRVGMH